MCLQIEVDIARKEKEAQAKKVPDSSKVKTYKGCTIEEVDDEEEGTCVCVCACVWLYGAFALPSQYLLALGSSGEAYVHRLVARLICVCVRVCVCVCVCAEEGAQLTRAQLERLEKDATNRSHVYKKKAEAIRRKRQEQIDEAQMQAEAAAIAAAAVAAAQSDPAPASAAAPAPAAAAAAVPAAAAADAAPVQQAEQGALALKDQGTKLFNAGDLKGAIATYTQALQLAEPGSELTVMCLGNLALAKLRLGDPQGALTHADAVLKVRLLPGCVHMHAR